jgi:methionyl-tRNA formyltransferase
VRSLRLAFFGTPEFAVPTLESLREGPHSVVVVVTQPDRRRGRGQRLSHSPVAEIALAAGTPLLRPESVNAVEFAEELRPFDPDLGVVVAFGQFIPKRIRQLPSLGYMINGHASLLPRFRGAAPIPHAILSGDTETGVSVMRLEREMDAGPVAAMRSVAIEEDETTGSLTGRIARLTADAIADVVEEIAGDRVVWTPQDETLATLAPKIEREDARLNFDEPAAALARRVRAMAPRPGAFAMEKDQPLRILAAEAIPGPSDDAPGTARIADDGSLRIATGEGWLVPRVLQRPGGRALDVRDFQRGRPISDGARLWNED